MDELSTDFGADLGLQFDALDGNDMNSVDRVMEDADMMPERTPMMVDNDSVNEISLMYDIDKPDENSYSGIFEDGKYNSNNAGIMNYIKAIADDEHNNMNKQKKRQPVTASCEQCGNIGMRVDFVGKKKRFCSINCSRTSSRLKQMKPDTIQHVHAIYNKKEKETEPKPGQLYVSDTDQPSYDWNKELKPISEGAPVACFKHVTMSEFWNNINNGVKVEVMNIDSNSKTVATYWIATVIRLVGYKALLRYEGFGTDSSCDFWINLCSQDVHPVGWCATKGKPLVPPKTVQHRYVDWHDFLVRRLTGARTLPHNFFNKVMDSVKNRRLKKGMVVEIMDKTCISAMRVACIDDLYGGRLHLKYLNSKEYDDFWAHEKSPLVHPVSWSHYTGHKIHCSLEYKNRTIRKLQTKQFDTYDATFTYFEKPKVAHNDYEKFEKGMKLEAIDPLNLSAICVASVMKVLKDDYLMIGIDGSMAVDGSDWFCYHATSPCIFPVGFCEINDIFLTQPRDYNGEFRWLEYLKNTGSVAAPVSLFEKEIPKHGFKVGMKLEAVDLMEPRLICVASIARVVGRLLRIHFDGWENSYDQWVDCQSTDIYPVGWCEMVGYRLEAPRTPFASPVAINSNLLQKKKKSKNAAPNLTRKRKKGKSAQKQLINEIQNKGPQESETCSPVSSTPDVVNTHGQMDIGSIQSLTGAVYESDYYIPVLTGDYALDAGKPLTPMSWSVADVSHFIAINGFAEHRHAFTTQSIDGFKLMELSSDNLTSITGSSSKTDSILDLIGTLRLLSIDH
ncbi:MBT domain-containing protein 1-like [Tubulanus polymorphus]|uniref:MBT domain-containing protein 1-like n=1 Tax=Tubulanus polymorphus TaxID=672921 RepID=UPI003DA2E759